MSLEHILLGLLRTPASGYDLKAVVDHGIGHFWAAELSQIYPTLRQLEQRRLVRARGAAGKRGPRRVVYATTAAGRKELAIWLRSGPQFGDMRHTFLAQIYMMDELSDLPYTLQFLERLRERWKRKLEELMKLEAYLRKRDARFSHRVSISVFHRHLTLRMGLHSYKGWAAWCEESIRRIRARMREENGHGEPVSNLSMGAHRRRRRRSASVLDSGNRPQGR